MSDQLKNLFTRGIAELIGEKELRAKLEKDPAKVVIKYGVDPTRPDIHIGHAVCLRKLREFQELGCRVIFLIGDFTAMIGDPSGRNKLRPELGLKEVHANMKTYLDQAKLILDEKKLIVVQNSTWYMTFDDFWTASGKPLPFFAKSKELLQQYITERSQWETNINKVKQFVSLRNLIGNLRLVTHGQLIVRDLFQERIKSGKEIYLNEFIYPILQGLDSWVIETAFGSCDLEIGGTDQKFNMLMGRQLQERLAEKTTKKLLQAVMTLEILEGTDGKEKMSKSLENYIGITESPTDMFGKTMRIPDELIPRWAELTTDLDPASFAKRLKQGENPKTVKTELAEAIITLYHSAEAAKKASAEFDRVHAGGGGGRPDDITTVKIEEGSWSIIELLATAKLVSSKSDARRLIEQGGVKANDKKIESIEENFEVGEKELILQVGKRKWAKITS